MPLGADQGLPDAAIHEIENKHLIRIEKRGGVSWCELAHDRLVRPVRESNAKWRQSNLSLLQRQAALWEEKGRSDGLLLSGKELVEVERWANNPENILLPQEGEFLEACQAHRNAMLREKKQIRRTRWLAIISVSLLIVACLGMVGAGIGISAWYGQWSQTLPVKRLLQQ